MIKRDLFQSILANDIINYISLKKGLGFLFIEPSRILLKLDQFLCTLAKPSPDLTAKTFRLWCQTNEFVCANIKLKRMRIIRNFCLYRRRTNPNCYVPDPIEFPKPHPPAQPYIFSDIEVAKILSYSNCLHIPQRAPLRAASTRLAIILFYTTGLRRGELLKLTTTDYNPSNRTLLIRESKFHKSRFLPLPNDVSLEVEKFLKLHNSIRPEPPADAPLIYSSYLGGRAYSREQLRRNIRSLFKLAGIRKQNGELPRIKDFRSSFAVNAILRWYRNGENVQAKLHFLSAYMGHSSILSTYYYLRFIEPLSAHVSSIFDTHYGSLIQKRPL